LEAAECPHTFGTPPKLIHAVIAGGSKAVWRSLEGAEDSYDNSRVNLSKLNINKKDVVLGIAASGSTPFVVTAMKYAKKVKASTLMLTFNPVNKKMADIIIAPIVGPEVIVGSTRMKAGTATKMILNMITTTLMIRMGKTYGNLMVDVQPKSQKLRNRARRIVKELVGTNYKKAESLLNESNWEVKTAVVMGIRKVSKIEAKRLLANQKGFLRKALD
jgi:N-acetylmuramic acid 6-phosphate etherase